MRHRSLAALVTVVSVSLAFLANTTSQAEGAGSLVLAALHVLETDYFKPVDATKLLNSAIAALRKATNQNPDVLPDIPIGVQESQAVGTFDREFDQAVKAGTVSEKDLAYIATREMLASLNDSHVYYMDPMQFKERQERDAGNVKYAGIGVFIKAVKGSSDANEIFVTDVFPGAPADTAGLKQFDRISGVDGTPFPSTASANDVAARVRGPEGTSVTLTIQRGSQTLTIPVMRAPIQSPSVEARMVKAGVVYIRLFSFSKGVGDQLRRLLKPLIAQGTIRAVILDLRGNTGGLASEDESIAGVFLPSQTMLARVLQRTGPTELVARGELLLPKAAVTILTDKFSMSGSEVVALGLRNAHRATIVGEKTAGALGLSRLVSLLAGGMNVTVSEIVGPQYEQIERVGITPDNQVELSASEMERGVDPQLEAALKTVGGTILSRLLAA